MLAEVHILARMESTKIEEEKGKWDLNKFQEKSQLILEIVEGRKENKIRRINLRSFEEKN